MKITKIEVQKRNKERVNIYIDDEFAFGLATEVMMRNFLKKGQVLTEEYINNILLEEEFYNAKEKALHFLGYRQRSKKEIVDRLKKDDIEDFIIEKVIFFLEDQQLLDDYEFAKSFAKDKIRLNNYGPQKIRYELYKKGIDKDIVDRVLDLDDSEYERALEAGEKKLYSYRNDKPQDQYRKLSAFLQRRGFSYSCVKDVVKELVEW